MLPLCVCNSVSNGQNIQNEISLERSIFADVVVYQLINCNWKLNGSRKEDMHRSTWNENDLSSRRRVNPFSSLIFITQRTLMQTHYPPSQFIVPSPLNPLNPGLQLHLKDPSSFWHVAFIWQLWGPPTHSSISTIQWFTGSVWNSATLSFCMLLP